MASEVGGNHIAMRRCRSAHWIVVWTVGPARQNQIHFAIAIDVGHGKIIPGQ